MLSFPTQNDEKKNFQPTGCTQQIQLTTNQHIFKSGLITDFFKDDSISADSFQKALPLLSSSPFL